MSQNRNMILFVLGSMALLGVAMLFSRKQEPQQPAPQAAQTAQQPQAAPAPAAPAQQAAPASAPVQDMDAAGFVERRNDSLVLIWRKADGALVQARWIEQLKDKTGRTVQEETPFFPWKDAARRTAAFPGLGGALDARFQGEPQVEARPDGEALTFRNADGDSLTWTIPAKGHVLRAQWTSPKGGRLSLLRSLKDLPKDASPVPVSGRLFTLEDKKIHAVTWKGMLTDPFFSFLGSKRDELPPATRRLGMDAGVAKETDQRNYYFAAIWDLPMDAQRDAGDRPGYNAAPVNGSVDARLYLGPKRDTELQAFHAAGTPGSGKTFTQVVDFGFFGVVAQVLFLILHWVHKAIPNWGWAIIVFTVIIRLALWTLNTKTTIGMLRMKELEPFQKELQAKYAKFGNDMAKKQEMQRELMAFYKKNGHNPMGTCWPMLVQMPFFLALWSMLSNVFDLRHAPFMGYLQDLSAKDPFYVLPVLLGASMLAQQAMTPAMGDPAQRKMMTILMPAMMVFIFLNLPAGLNLYYLVFNIVGLGQTWWVMKNYKPQTVKV